MELGTGLKLADQKIIKSATVGAGTDEVTFRVVTGARMLVTLVVTSMDPGAQIDLDMADSISGDDAYQSMTPGVSTQAAGQFKRVYSDFNPQIRARWTVTGGNVTFKISVVLFDNASTTRIENAHLTVEIDAKPDSLGHYDSVRIGDGTDELEINSDGSINVNDDLAVDEVPANPYGESPAVAPGVETTVLTYVVPADKTAFLYRAEGAGENIARYQVFVNGSVIATRRSHFGELNTSFEFATPVKRSIVLQPSDVVEIKVIHNRPDSGNFEARLQLLLKTPSV